MREEFILAFIPRRICQLGYQDYHIRYREVKVGCGDTVKVPGYRDLYFLIGSPLGVRIESDYGRYDSTGEKEYENTYQHKGQIKITNTTQAQQSYQFIQVVLLKKKVNLCF